MSKKINVFERADYTERILNAVEMAEGNKMLITDIYTAIMGENVYTPTVARQFALAILEDIVKMQTEGWLNLTDNDQMEMELTGAGFYQVKYLKNLKKP